MFLSGTPLVTQLVIYAVLLAFHFGAVVYVYQLVKRMFGGRPDERLAT